MVVRLGLALLAAATGVPSGGFGKELHISVGLRQKIIAG
jgi:hypothetical protein